MPRKTNAQQYPIRLVEYAVAVMKLLVVIVNYRTPQMTVDCLESIAGEIGSLRGKVAVVDNASPDDSVRHLRQAIDERGWQDWAALMPLDRNGGFAYGNNAAIQPALASSDPPDYVLLLNPDTIARPGALGALVDFLASHPEVGMVGSRLEDPDGTPQRSAFRFHTLISEFDGAMKLGLFSLLAARHVVAPPVSAIACPAQWVAGASLLIRRQVFDSIGLLDAKYFMYFEEVDFCQRAAKAGWPCWYEPKSRVVHLVGQASGVTNRSDAQRRRPAYWFESRRYYWIKNYGKAYAAAVDAVWIVGYAGWRLRAWLQRKPSSDPPSFFWDSLRHSVFVKGFRA